MDCVALPLVDIEDKLYSFHEYSFNNYAKLKVINTNLMAFVNNNQHLFDKQAILDLNFELENERTVLEDLRFAKDKNEEFLFRVQAAMSVINRLMKFFPVEKPAIAIIQPNITLYDTFLSRFKRWFHLKGTFDLQ